MTRIAAIDVSAGYLQAIKQGCCSNPGDIEEQRMSSPNLKATYTVYFDDSGEPTDIGQPHSVIAAVLVREELHDNVDAQMQKVWAKYMPGIDRMEFHATEMEGATGSFSHLHVGELLRMQKEFIQIIGQLDLPVVAVTVDNRITKSSTTFGIYWDQFDAKVFATSLAIGLIVGLFIDVSKGEHCKLVVDEGLIHPKHKGNLERAIELLRVWGGRKADNLVEQLGFASSDTLSKFLVDADVPQIESHKSVGIQLADHVARYVFKHSKELGAPDPQYLELCSVGLKDLKLNQNTEVAKFIPGLNIHLRAGQAVVFAPASTRKRATPLDLEKTIIPEFERLLKSELVESVTCPKCKANLFWGCPTPEIRDAADTGELLLCGERIREKNYCPRCRALIFTRRVLLQRWINMGGPRSGGKDAA